MNGFPPLPATPILLTHLLGLVFIFHLVFMNYVVAGPVVAAWFLLAKGEAGRLRGLWMLRALPVALTFTINFGVASLLFAQVIYAEKFFTANILLGSVWLSVIGLLMVAFYGAYVAGKLSEISKRSPRWAGLVCLVVTALIWAIGLIMICNYFISTQTDNWTALRLAPLSVTESASFVPRGLHFMMGSFAVTGFWMMWIAWWRSRRGENHYDIVKLFKQGAALAAGATAGQVVAGIWLVLSLSSAGWDELFSGSVPSVIWISGVASGLLLLGSLLIINFTLGRFFWLKISSGLLIYTFIGMVAGRDIVRQAAMGASFSLNALPSQPQAGAMVAFALILVIGLLGLGYLLRLIWRTPPARTDA